MNINWKVRFRNKVWLTAFIAALVSFGFAMMELFDIAPAVSEGTIMQAVQAVIVILTGMGVLVDPTTKGMSDSERAMSYEEPG